MKRALIAGAMLLALASLPVTNAQTLMDSSLTVTQIVGGLNVPTAIAFLGTNDFLVLEKSSGKVRRVIDGDLQPTPVLDVAVDNTDERGLLGITFHPGFATNHYVYLSYSESSTSNDTTNVDPLGLRIYRYEWNGSELENGLLIFEFPVTAGVTHHNGGVILFGPDGKLYAVTGDHEKSGQLQNQILGPAADDTSVIVRLNDDGSVPGDNPFFAQGGNLAKYYAYGIRNSFGLAFDPQTGNLWETENGPDSYDEINLVSAGFNSGWRGIYGPTTRSGGSTNQLYVVAGSHYAEPQFSWGHTVAPTGLAFLDSGALGEKYRHHLFVGDFNNGTLYQFALNNARDGFVLTASLADKVADTTNETKAVTIGTGFSFGPGSYSGISDVRVGPDGRLYVVSIGRGAVYAIASVPPVHDLAVTSLKAPKKVALTAKKPSQIKKLKIKLVNQGNQTEIFDDAASLTNAAALTIESLGLCNVPVSAVVTPKTFPFSLEPKKKLNITVNLTFDCVNDGAAGPGHEDFRYTTTADFGEVLTDVFEK